MQDKNKEGIERNIMNGVLHARKSGVKFMYLKKNTLHDVKKGNKLENNKRKQNGTPLDKENNLYN